MGKFSITTESPTDVEPFIKLYSMEDIDEVFAQSTKQALSSSRPTHWSPRLFTLDKSIKGAERKIPSRVCGEIWHQFRPQEEDVVINLHADVSLKRYRTPTPRVRVDVPLTVLDTSESALLLDATTLFTKAIAWAVHKAANHPEPGPPVYT